MQPFCLQFGEEETLVSRSLFLQKSWEKADKVPPKELSNLEDSRGGTMGICPVVSGVACHRSWDAVIWTSCFSYSPSSQGGRRLQDKQGERDRGRMGRRR